MRNGRENIPPYDLTPRVIAQDDRISPEALGLLVFLRSLPLDWEIVPKHIKKRFSWGKDKFQRVMKELVDHDYVELVKGGKSGGSGYKLRTLVEDEVLRMLSKTKRSRDPTTESRETRSSVDAESRKSPTSVKPDSRKKRLSNKEYTFNTEYKKIMELQSTKDGGPDFSFLKDERDLFYLEEIGRVYTEIGDPCMIWTNQTGRSGAGAAPFSTIMNLVRDYGLEIYTAGVVIGANESKNVRISLRYCSAIMKRLHKQRETDRRPLDLKKDELDRLGSQFEDL